MIDLNGHVGWPGQPSCSRCKCRTNDICSGIHIGQELRYCEADRAPISMKNVSKSRIDVLQSKLDGELLCQLEIHCVYKIFLGSRGVCVHAHRPRYHTQLSLVQHGYSCASHCASTCAPSLLT